MSVEEDVELKDLLAQTLETNGCLARIRAQLRASIFLALDEDIKLSRHQPLMNNKIKTHLETEEGKTMFCIVREFLEFFNLCFTVSVFEPESYAGTCYQYEGRQKVAKALGLDVFEDKTVPLLLQLIRIAQARSKSIEIDLNFNSTGADESKSSSQDVDVSVNLKKTDSDNLTSNVVTNDNKKTSGDDSSLIENGSLEPKKLNTTYDLSSPTISLKLPENDIKSQSKEERNTLKQNLDNDKQDGKGDDTYEDTSSIAEDTSHNVLDMKVPEITMNGVEDDTLVENDSEASQPILRDKADKLKLSPQKSDKMKSKSSLNSLADLPPLQMTKPRVNDILPSLYSKEFKDKSNLSELDKLFDMEADYEEDFMCSGDDLSAKSDYLKSDHSKINLLEDLHLNKSPNSDKASISSKKDAKQNKPSNRIISDCNKPLFKSLVNSQKGKDIARIGEGINKNGNGSSNSSVSEHLEVASSD